jgi:hypothetical protein
MANTYVQIGSTVTVGSGGAANIEFTSIPATYTDLKIVVSARATINSGALGIYFNGTTSGYSWRRLIGDGSSAFSDSTASYPNLRAIGTNPSTYTASTFANTEIYIPNYAGNTNKSVSVDAVNENNATAAETSFLAGLWSNTAAITSVTLIPNSDNFAQYSTASLYGISKS